MSLFQRILDCGHCGKQVELKSFRLTSNKCPHCGEELDADEFKIATFKTNLAIINLPFSYFISSHLPLMLQFKDSVFWGWFVTTLVVWSLDAHFWFEDSRKRFVLVHITLFGVVATTISIALLVDQVKVLFSR